MRGIKQVLHLQKFDHLREEKSDTSTEEAVHLHMNTYSRNKPITYIAKIANSLFIFATNDSQKGKTHTNQLLCISKGENPQN